MRQFVVFAGVSVAYLRNNSCINFLVRQFFSLECCAKQNQLIHGETRRSTENCFFVRGGRGGARRTSRAYRIFFAQLRRPSMMAADRPLCDQPQFARVGRCNAIRSGDKQFIEVAAREAAGPGGAARVMAGLITTLLRPVALPLGRFAAGVLCVRAGERLANATVCRFCGCVCRWRAWFFAVQKLAPTRFLLPLDTTALSIHRNSEIPEFTSRPPFTPRFFRDIGIVLPAKTVRTFQLYRFLSPFHHSWTSTWGPCQFS